MKEVKVLKFGGTSVGSADAMHEVIDIIEKNSHPQIIVLSAMSGTTNDLVSIHKALISGDRSDATRQVEEMDNKYTRVLTDLYPDKEDRDKGRTLLKSSFAFLRSQLNAAPEHIDEKEILAQGELISTRLFALISEIRGLSVKLVSALDFMRIEPSGEPDMDQISALWQPHMELMDEDCQILITQGYICRNRQGKVDNLNRGGSDYTATLVGAVTPAREVQIWTDIDGVHNNDPRVVSDTVPIPFLSYREAAELAFFGAKILHPTCVLPVEQANVPLRLKYTMDPHALGTLISAQSSGLPITAVAAKDHVTCIKVYSDRMLHAYGFLTRLFGVFEKYRTPVDMITTSEVSVSLTIDNLSHLSEIMSELEAFAEAEVTHEYSIVCIVGNELDEVHHHITRIVKAIEGLPVRMISAGGSKYNVSILTKTINKTEMLKALNTLLVQTPSNTLEN